MTEFTINSRVSIIWKETGKSFEAMIEKVNSDGSVDARYDALVNGKVLRETAIAIDRIVPILEDVYFSFDDMGSKSLAHTDQDLNFTINDWNLERENISIANEEPTEYTNKNIIHLCLSVTSDAINGLDREVLIQKLIKIHSQLDQLEDSSKLIHQLQFGCSTSEIYDSIDQFEIFLHCAAALLRAQVVLVEKESLVSGTFEIQQIKRLTFSDENLEKVAVLVYEFLSKNLGLPSGGHPAGTDSTSPEKEISSKKGKGRHAIATSTEAEKKKLFLLMMSRCIPLIQEYFDLMRMLFKFSHPRSKLSYLLLEASLLVVGVDPTANKSFDFLRQKILPDMVKIGRSACLLLRILFTKTDFRSTCLNGLVSRVFAAAALKNPWRPISIESSNQQQISLPIHCLIICLQACVREAITPGNNILLAAGEDTINSINPSSTVCDDYLLDCSKVAGDIISEFIHRCGSKESSLEYFQAVSFTLEELLIALQSPLHFGALLIFEQFVLTLSAMLKKLLSNEQDSVNSNGKRDLTQIGQLLEVLGTVAEGLGKCGITWENRSSSAKSSVHTELAQFVSERLRGYWRSNPPIWLELIKGNGSVDEEYWSIDPESSQAGKDSISLKDSNFLQFMDALLEISDNVSELVLEAQGVSDRLKLSPLEDDIKLFFLILPQLHDQYNLAALTNCVIEGDIYFAQILRYLADTYELKSVNSDEVLLGNELPRDSLFMLLGLWMKNLKFSRREKYISSVADLACSFSQKKANISEKLMIRYEPIFLSDKRGKRGLQSQIIASKSLSIAKTRSLNGFLAKLLDTFLVATEDVSPQIRTKALKALTRLAHFNLGLHNDHILQLERVQQVVQRIFSSDRSIAVREECVKLVGGFIGCAEQKDCELYSFVLVPLLEDEGISVRKSVITIFRDALGRYPCHAFYREICWALLERLAHPKEEESIKEQLITMFQNTWFLPPLFSAAAALVEIFAQNREDDAKVRFLKSIQKTQRPDYSLLHLRFTAMALVETSQKITVRPLILKLLKELLHGKAEGDEVATHAEQRRAESVIHCEGLLSFQEELLLLTEEGNENMLRYISESGLRENGSDILVQADEYKARVIATMALFCSTHPPFVSKHLHVFLPYLKDPGGVGNSSTSTGTHMEICGHVMRMISATCLLSGSVAGAGSALMLLRDRANEVQVDIMSIALRQSGENVSIAVECIALIAHHVTQDARRFLKLAETCFNPLIDLAVKLEVGGEAAYSPAMGAKLQRSLAVLGCICEHARKCSPEIQNMIDQSFGRSISEKEYSKWDIAAAQSDLRDAHPLHPFTLFGSAYSAALFGLELEVEAVQARAAKALCGVWIGCPRLMTQANDEGVLAHLLGPEYSQTVHERFLAGLKEMMESEEARLDQLSSLQQMEESGVALSKSVGSGVLVNSDSTVAGFVLQQHLPSFRAFLRHQSSFLRLSTIQLLGTLLRQGMVCPLDILSFVIMLQGDVSSSTTDEPGCVQGDLRGSDAVRAESLRILQTLDERYPTFLDARMLEGVDLIFDFQLELLGESRALSAETRRAILAPLYASCIQSNKKRRTTFLAGLLKRVSAHSSVTVGLHAASQLPPPVSPGKTSAKASQPSSPTHASPARGESHISSVSDALLRLSRAEFLSLILVHLPYNSSEEVQVFADQSHGTEIETSHWLGVLKSALISLGVSFESIEKEEALVPENLLAQSLLSKVKHIVAAVDAVVALRCLETGFRLRAFLRAAFNLGDGESTREAFIADRDFRPGALSVKLAIEKVVFPVLELATGSNVYESCESDKAIMRLVEFLASEFNRASKMLELADAQVIDRDDFLESLDGSVGAKRHSQWTQDVYSKRGRAAIVKKSSKISKKRTNLISSDEDDSSFDGTKGKIKIKSQKKRSATKHRRGKSNISGGGVSSSTDEAEATEGQQTYPQTSTRDSSSRQRGAKRPINYALLGDEDG